MEKRIKMIRWLTIFALIALVIIQGYWLTNQYIYILQLHEDELFQKTVELCQKDKVLRKELQDRNFYSTSQWEMKVTQSPASFGSEVDWELYVYVFDKNEVKFGEASSLQEIDSLAVAGKGIVKYRFDVSTSRAEFDIFDALERFQVNKLSPFNTSRFDSLLQEQSVRALFIKTEATDSMLWEPQKTIHASIRKPIMEIVYPFDILGKEQVRVTYKLGMYPILGRMFGSFVGSIILSFLLIFCLTYQMRTIFKQRRIDELRKDFITTMIHELKRPVTMLKLCISFMKNDKMMQDKQVKEDIIHSSQNELDNLSSYFSKLRDLTYGYLEEVPLNLSSFNLKELIVECIGKKTLPTERKININTRFDDSDGEIVADKMHISNIIYNLLENAVKYSEGETSICISCNSTGDGYRIEVEDNGIGIPLAECDYVFDKYFRSSAIVDKNIPGIGLGLSYVKLLVIAHKGKISLKSNLGEGSKFIIEIPGKQ
jgi:two-component system phosphate regulon sensor histidine kinase PhoR